MATETTNEWLHGQVQVTEVAYVSPASSPDEDELILCPGCAVAFGAPSDGYEPLVTTARLAEDMERCDLCAGISWVTVFILEFGGWITLQGQAVLPKEVWEAHREELSPNLIELLVELDILEEK